MKWWTKSDDATLRQLLDEGLGRVDIAERMGRTKKAVTGRAKRLGRGAIAPDQWTDAELAIVAKGVAEGRLAREIKPALPGRSSRAIWRAMENCRDIGGGAGTGLVRPPIAVEEKMVDRIRADGGFPRLHEVALDRFYARDGRLVEVWPWRAAA